MLQDPRPLPSHDRLHQVLSYDHLTGILTWKFNPEQDKRWNTRYAGKEAGCERPGGRTVHISPEGRFLASRIIWKMMTGEDPSGEVDHENLNRGNNRWANLRDATRAQNCQNRVRVRRLDLPKGVYETRGRYQASIRVNGVNRHLGMFSDPQEAHAAYCKAAVHHFGEFARFSR